MKSPRDRSMVVVAILSAGAVVVAAGLTSSHALSSLVRGSSQATVTSYAQDTLELPVETVDAPAQSKVAAGDQPRGVAPTVEAAPAEDLSPVVVDQVKSEMTRLSALPRGVPERAQALADQVSDGAPRPVVIVYWDDSAEPGPAWTHTRVPGESAVRAPERETVVERLEGWNAEQLAGVAGTGATVEIIVQD